MKKGKKIWIPVLCGVVLIAALVLFFVLRSNAKTVDVYAVPDCGMTDYWGDSMESYGEVTTDQMQTVYISESQTVKSVSVKKGQRVKAGDPLLTYDTTLTELQLQRKELEIKRAELDLTNAKKELATLEMTDPSAMQMAALPFYGQAVSLSALPAEGLRISLLTDGGAVSTYSKLGGTGTADDPYRYVVANGLPLNKAFVQEVLGEAQQAHVVFQQRENNLPTGRVLAAWGVLFAAAEDGDYTFSFFDASKYVEQKPAETTAPPTTQPPTTQPTQPPTTRDDPVQPMYPAEPVDPGPTAQELAQMRAEKQREIRDLDLKLRQLKVEYEQMKAEMDSGVVVSKLNGEVIAVEDPKTAFQNNEPVVKVSGGGGYYVNGSVSELVMDSLEVGQSVSVSAWESGTSCEGEVRSISTTPVSGDGGSGAGNYNVSYYGFTVYIDADNDLKEHEYVSITYDAGGDNGDHIYLEVPFVLSENGKSYVYIQNEENRLEKREVKTGKNVWGSYIEILEGVTAEDYIAFPYDKNLKEGRKVQQADISELYS